MSSPYFAAAKPNTPVSLLLSGKQQQVQPPPPTYQKLPMDVVRDMTSLELLEVKPDLSAAEFLLFEKSKKVVDQALLRAINNEDEFLGYQWPPHMDKQQHSLIWSWFQRYCCSLSHQDPREEDLPSDEQVSSFSSYTYKKKNLQQRRKKALVLFSEKRGLGKTTFATSLVYGQENCISIAKKHSIL